MNTSTLQVLIQNSDTDTDTRVVTRGIKYF